MATESSPTNSKLINEKTLAARICVARATLRKWRHYGRGPTFVKLGGAVRYNEAAVNEWIAKRTVAGETDGQ